MAIREVIVTVNQMKADGVIENYAIGGAVGATFYLGAISTLDVDVFIVLAPQPNSLLLSVGPIFEYLTARGGTIEGEHIVLANWPVQFLPPTNALVEDAMREAVQFEIGDMTASVFSAEHLAAIALQTGRAKDKMRLAQFWEAGILEEAHFVAILSKHGLEKAWHQFKIQFLAG